MPISTALYHPCLFKWTWIALLLIVALLSIHFTDEDWNWYTERGRMRDKREVVVVTGSTSGIGYELSKRLANDAGFVVFGTYRSPKDVPMLEAVGIRPLQMEITSEESIIEAEKQVRSFIESNKDSMRFLGVVSNAGVLNAGPFEKVSRHLLTHTLDVHLKGTLLLTKIFMDLIKSEKGGRIVVMGSLAALLLPPANAAYNAAKAGQQAFALSLRQELVDQDVAVSLIVCGETRGTKLHTNRATKHVDWSGGYELFKRTFDLGSEWMGNSFMGTTFENLHEITKDALTSTRPRAKYYAPAMLKPLTFISPSILIQKMMRTPPPEWLM